MTTTETKDEWANAEIYGRHFIRAEFGSECLLEGETTQGDLDADKDTFFCGIVNAEMAANHDKLDCAACGSRDIVRAPLTDPASFRTVTDVHGRLYGYALCRSCREADVDAITEKVDTAFDRLTAH